VLFLVPLLALCLRARELPAFARTAVALVLTPVLVSLPVYLVSPVLRGRRRHPDAGRRLAAGPARRRGAGRPRTAHDRSQGRTARRLTGVNAAYRFFQLNTERPADWDSLWFVLQEVRGEPLGSGPGTPTVLNAAGRGVLPALPRRRRGAGPARAAPTEAAAGAVPDGAGVPAHQQGLEPAVLAVAAAAAAAGPAELAGAAGLAGRRGAGALHAVLPLHQPGHRRVDGIGVDWFLSALLLRDGVLVVIAALVVREVLEPERDVVRADGVDDPAGGVLDGRPDRRPPMGTSVPVRSSA
jgi:hypothetical protein